MKLPNNLVAHRNTCQPIQSMTNAVKNSSRRSPTSLAVLGVFSRFLNGSLMQGFAKIFYSRSEVCAILGLASGGAEMRVYIREGSVRVGHLAWFLRIDGKCKFQFSVLNESINRKTSERFYLRVRNTK